MCTGLKRERKRGATAIRRGFGHLRTWAFLMGDRQIPCFAGELLVGSAGGTGFRAAAAAGAGARRRARERGAGKEVNE